MTDELYETVAKYGLTGIGVNVFGAPANPYIGVYVHFDDGCASGSAPTFSEALHKALTEMDERKQAQAILAKQKGEAA